MFKKGETYIVNTTRYSFIAQFAGMNETALPFLQWNNVVFLSEGLYSGFLRNGNIDKKQIEGAFSFGSGFWVQERWITQAMHVAVQVKPDLKPVPDAEPETKAE